MRENLERVRLANFTDRNRVFGSRATLRVIAVVLFGAWAAFAWIAIASTRELDSDLARSAQTRRVLDTLNALEKSVIYFNNAERGYDITGDASYLKLAEQDAQDVYRLLARAREMTAGNPTLQRGARDIQALVHARIDFSRQIVDVRRKQGLEAMSRLVATGNGKRLNATIRTALETMRHTEYLALQDYQQHIRAYRRTANITTALAFGLVGLAIVAIVVLSWLRYQTAQRLLTSQANYRELFEASPNPIWVADAETRRFLLVNEAAVQLYGYDRETMLALSVADIEVPPDRQPPDVVFSQGGSAPALQRHRTRDGEDRILAVRTRPINSDGGPRQLSIASDVTQREAAVAELRRSEARFQQIFELQFQLMALLDRSGTILQGNSLMARAAGKPRNELIGRKLAGLGMWRSDGNREEAARLARRIERIQHGDEPILFDLAYRSTTAERRVLEASLRPVENGDNDGYLIFQAKDVTARVHALEALHRSERRLLAAQERAALGSWEIDLRDGSVWWSAKMRKLFDIADEQSPPTLDEMPRLGTNEDASRIARFLEQRQQVIGSATLWFERAPDRGGGCHLEMVAECLFDREGKAVQLVGTMMDVTDRIAMERRLVRSQRLEAIGKLTGGVAHDFNNLLTVILGNAEVMIEATGDKDELHAAAKLSLHAALRCAELTQQLLAFARRQPLAPSVIDPAQLVEDMRTLLEKTVAADIDLKILTGAGSGLSCVDRAQVESAILNLAINARDAMPDGGRLTIEVSDTTLDAGFAGAHYEAAPGHYVLIVVSDTGHGMTAAVIDRAFEPFFTTKPMGNNSGLGLSMVHGFVKQSGGHIALFSEPRRGTTVKIYLPRSLAREENIVEIAAPPPLRGKERILLVEDDDLVRRHVASQLQGLGYAVVAARHGREALDRLAHDQVFDLLFTDVLMPGNIDGPQLAQAAEKLVPGLPVLFTSGYTENAIAHNGRVDPGTHLLSKPYQLGTLAEKVRSAIDEQAGKQIVVTTDDGAA